MLLDVGNVFCNNIIILYYGWIKLYLASSLVIILNDNLLIDKQIIRNSTIPRCLTHYFASNMVL